MNEDDEVMVDETEMDTEVEYDEEPAETEASDEPDPIKDFINYIDNSDYNRAEDQFKDLIDDRLQVALDQARARIAGEFYNDTPAEDESSEEETAELDQETA